MSDISKQFLYKHAAQTDCVTRNLEALKHRFPNTALGALALVGLRVKLGNTFNAAWYNTHGDADRSAQITDDFARDIDRLIAGKRGKGRK